MTRNHESHSDETRNILLAVLAGSVVGALTAAVIGSAKGEALKEELHDVYNLASRKVSNAAQMMGEKTHDITDRFLGRPQKHTDHLNLVIGAIAGGILGVSTIVFLSGKSAKGIRKQAFHSFECLSDKAHCLEDKLHTTAGKLEENISYWVNKAGKVINAFNEDPGYQSKKNGLRNEGPLDKILDWALVAAQVVQSFKK